MTYLNDSFYFMLLALNVSLICIYLLNRQRKLQRELEQLKRNSRNELDTVVSSLQTMLQRQRYLAAEMTNQSQRIQQLRDAQSVEPGFDHANRLLGLGLDSEQLAHGLRLSEAEARLMSLVHRQHDRKRDAPVQSRAAHSQGSAAAEERSNGTSRAASEHLGQGLAGMADAVAHRGRVEVAA